MPLEELPVVVQRTRCDAIVLSGAIKPNPEMLSQELPALVRQGGVPVFVGGITAKNFSEEIMHAGARPVGSDLVLGLHEIEHLVGTFSRPAKSEFN